MLVLGMLFVVRATAPAEIRLDDVVQDALTLAVSVVVESLPFVILGVMVSIAVQLWVPGHLMFRILPRTPILRRGVLSLLGVALPVCECGNVPLARTLMTRGLTVSDSMTFLLAAPILNPITILVTYQAFGLSDGILLWRDPHGQVYLVDHTCTRRVTEPGHPAGSVAAYDPEVGVYPTDTVIQVDFGHAG